MKKLKRKFWLWVDKQIVLSNVDAGVDRLKRKVFDEVTTHMNEDFNNPTDFDGVAPFVDDGVRIISQETRDKIDGIIKGYESQ